MNTNDRRIRKTKKALREALVKLLVEKDLYNITVQELADTADIHRGTFYAHYQDIYDLYQELEKSVIEELNTIIISDEKYTCEGLYTSLIDYIYSNASFCKMLFMSQGNHNFQNLICAWLETNYVDGYLKEGYHFENIEKMRLLATYHIRGCVALIRHWVETDFSYPKSDIIKLLHDVDYNIDKMFL